MSIFDSMNNITHSTHIQAHQSMLAQTPVERMRIDQAAILSLEAGVFWNPPVPNEEELNNEKARLIKEFLKFSADYREAYINSLKAKSVQDAMSPGSSMNSGSAFMTIHGYKGSAVVISISELENAHCSAVIEGLISEEE